MKVIVPPALLAAPESVALIELAVIALPTVAVVGAPAVSRVEIVLTDIDAIPAPQGVLDGALLASPL
jgi:hypothetical protein